MKHLHVEALCLMEYASADGNEVEFIWNSRDGVTPFAIQSRLGTELRHANWRCDRYLPDYRPQPGSRIFIDCPLEEARTHSLAYAKRHWEEAKTTFATLDEFVEFMLRDLQPGSPAVRVVPEPPTPDGQEGGEG